MSTRTASPRKAQYERDAAHALRQAIVFRDFGRDTGSPVDRRLMRRFAHHWRDYSRRARACKAL